MTSTSKRDGRTMPPGVMGKPANAGNQTSGNRKAVPNQRSSSLSSANLSPPHSGLHSMGISKMGSSKAGSSVGGTSKTGSSSQISPVVLNSHQSLGVSEDVKSTATAIEQCVQRELRQYFDMLDGEEPANLYRMVVRQAEHAVINMVMDECRGNQTRASECLGISRGNLRSKLASMEK